jgi:hypothetical protein
MYASSQKVLRGMGRLGDDTGSTIGGAAGTVIAPGIGTAIGGFIGGLFGGKSAPQNPGGPTAFARWASEGHFDWVASVALTMSGPDWSRDPNDTGQPWKTGYSPADAQSATAVLRQYNLTPQQAMTKVANPGGGVPATGTFSTSGVGSLASGMGALTANPLLLVGIAAGLYFLSRKQRR